MIKSPPRPILALITGSLLIVVCYFFVDRPLAIFLHSHPLAPPEFLRYPEMFSELLGWCVVAGIIGVVAWRIWRRGGPLQTLLLATAASLVAAFVLKSVLKWTFGRTWPVTWGNNRLLIANTDYGFYPFHVDIAHGSFPSGHAAATFAAVSVIWLGRPRWRWPCALFAAAVCAALVGLNFHFAGDVIAGAMLGSATGFYSAKVFGLLPEEAGLAPKS